eukprot:g43383.t1
MRFPPEIQKSFEACHEIPGPYGKPSLVLSLLDAKNVRERCLNCYPNLIVSLALQHLCGTPTTTARIHLPTLGGPAARPVPRLPTCKRASTVRALPTKAHLSKILMMRARQAEQGQRNCQAFLPQLVRAPRSYAQSRDHSHRERPPRARHLKFSRRTAGSASAASAPSPQGKPTTVRGAPAQGDPVVRQARTFCASQRTKKSPSAGSKQPRIKAPQSGTCHTVDCVSHRPAV